MSYQGAIPYLHIHIHFFSGFQSVSLATYVELYQGQPNCMQYFNLGMQLFKPQKIFLKGQIDIIKTVFGFS